MAGEVGRAAAGIQAPSQGSAVGDFGAAIASVVKGAREEEERRRKQAMEDAFLALEQEKADQGRKQLELTGRQIETQATMAEAQKTQAKAQADEEARLREQLEDQRRETEASIALWASDLENNFGYSRESLRPYMDSDRAMKDLWDAAHRVRKDAADRTARSQETGAILLSNYYATISPGIREQLANAQTRLDAINSELMGRITKKAELGSLDNVPMWVKDPENFQKGTPAGDVLATVTWEEVNGNPQVRQYLTDREISYMSMETGIDISVQRARLIREQEFYNGQLQQASDVMTSVVNGMGMGAINLVEPFASSKDPQAINLTLSDYTIDTFPGSVTGTNADGTAGMGGSTVPSPVSRMIQPGTAESETLFSMAARDPANVLAVIRGAGFNFGETYAQALQQQLEAGGFTPDTLAQAAAEQAEARGLADTFRTADWTSAAERFRIRSEVPPVPVEDAEGSRDTVSARGKHPRDMTLSEATAPLDSAVAALFGRIKGRGRGGLSKEQQAVLDTVGSQRQGVLERILRVSDPATLKELAVSNGFTRTQILTLLPPGSEQYRRVADYWTPRVER